MDTEVFARKDCQICGGKGRVKTGDGITDWAVCRCAILGQRMMAAEERANRLFPGRARDMTFSAYNTGGHDKNERALKVARNFVANYPQACREGWIIGFWGNPNCGKTHLAVAIALAAIKRYRAKPLMVNVAKMLRQERERFRDESLSSPIEAAAQAELLILDDLGAQYERDLGDPEKVTWAMEQLYYILDERIMGNRPTIYTTNYAPSDMERRMSSEPAQRVLTRIQRAEVTPPLEVVQVADITTPQKDTARRLLFG